MRRLSGEAHLVAHDHHGHAGGLQVAHYGEHASYEFRVKGRGGLVEQNDFRLERDGAGNGDALLLAAGKFVWIGARLVLEPHPVKGRESDRLGLRIGKTCHLAQRQRDIAQGRHVGIEVEGLEHHADTTARGVDVVLGMQEIDPVDEDRAVGRLLQAIEAAQKCALARARRADDEYEFLRLDGEIDSFENRRSAEGLAEAPHLKDQVAPHRHHE